MLPAVTAKLPQIERLCRRYRVRRLELFGSAATATGTGTVRDLDFLVDLGEAPPADYADAYFGLLGSLQSLFRRPVDLVTMPSITNRYFRQGIARTRRPLYAA